VLRAPYFEQEVVGPGMLDRLASALFGDDDPSAVMFEGAAQTLDVLDDGALLRLALPFADKGDITLKQIGLELVVTVDGQRRTIMLPPALAAMRPGAATFEDGSLEIRFSG
jgi:arsenite-transporting ATPase